MKILWLTLLGALLASVAAAQPVVKCPTDRVPPHWKILLMRLKSDGVHSVEAVRDYLTTVPQSPSAKRDLARAFYHAEGRQRLLLALLMRATENDTYPTLNVVRSHLEFFSEPEFAAVAQEIWKHAPEDAQMVDWLLNNRFDPQPRTRKLSVIALAHFPLLSANVRTKLRDFADDSSSEVRAEFIRQIKRGMPGFRLGHELPLLVERLKDEHALVRRVAANALVSTGDPRLLAVVFTQSSDNDVLLAAKAAFRFQNSQNRTQGLEPHDPVNDYFDVEIATQKLATIYGVSLLEKEMLRATLNSLREKPTIAADEKPVAEPRKVRPKKEIDKGVNFALRLMLNQEPVWRRIVEAHYQNPSKIVYQVIDHASQKHQPNRRIRALAMEALASIDPAQEPRLAPTYVDALSDPSPEVRAIAVVRVKRLPLSTPGLLPALLSRIHPKTETDPDIRGEAFILLGTKALYLPEVQDALISLMEHSVPVHLPQLFPSRGAAMVRITRTLQSNLGPEAVREDPQPWRVLQEKLKDLQHRVDTKDPALEPPFTSQDRESLRSLQDMLAQLLEPGAPRAALIPPGDYQPPPEPVLFRAPPKNSIPTAAIVEPVRQINDPSPPIRLAALKQAKRLPLDTPGLIDGVLARLDSHQESDPTVRGEAFHFLTTRLLGFAQSRETLEDLVLHPQEITLSATLNSRSATLDRLNRTNLKKLVSEGHGESLRALRDQLNVILERVDLRDEEIVPAFEPQDRETLRILIKRFDSALSHYAPALEP